MEKKEFILCAAIKRVLKTEVLPIYHNSDLHTCVLGYRHPDILIQNHGIVSKKLQDQGFYTSNNRYVGRAEALKIAIEAGQVSSENLCNHSFGLFSEDLY